MMSNRKAKATPSVRIHNSGKGGSAHAGEDFGGLAGTVWSMSVCLVITYGALRYAVCPFWYVLSVIIK